MNITIGRSIFLMIFLLCFSLVFGLEFSKDTIRAFDGPEWGFGDSDDSTVVHNNSESIVTIDSLIFDFDTSLYDNSFSVGWMESDGIEDNAGNLKHRRIFTDDDSTAHVSCYHDSTRLSVYNARLTGKIQIAPKSTITIFSPWISSTCSVVGVHISCPGPYGCYGPDRYSIKGKFTGKMIFISQNNRDTLNLACEKTDWYTNIVNKTPNRVQHVTNQKSDVEVTVLGQKIGFKEKRAFKRTLMLKRRTK